MLRPRILSPRRKWAELRNAGAAGSIRGDMMERARLWPPVRLPALALCAVVGVWAGGHGLGAGAWLVGAVVAGVVARGTPVVQWCAVVGLVAAALGARAAAPVPPPAGVTVDDREADVIVGWVSGPLAATRWGTGFEVDMRGVRVRVLAAGEVDVLPGDRVRVTGAVRSPRGYRNPGAVDRVAMARTAGVAWEVTAREVVIEARGDRASAWRWPAATARDASARVAARGGDRAGNALVRAAVLGDRSALDDEIEAEWRAAGVFHALSVSGLHLAAVALVAFVGVGRLWALLGLGAHLAPRRAAAAVALPMAVAYTLVTGAQIATVRALLVVAVVLVGELLARRARAADALGLAALVVLALSPASLHDPGFQLSFVAAATLILAAAPGGRVAGAGWRGKLVRALGTSAAVTAATAPITAWHFHEVSFGGVIGNLVATPLVELVVIPLGLAGMALAALVPAVGGVVIDLSVALAGVGARLVAALGACTPSLAVPPPSPLELVACAALYAAWAGARTGWLSARRAALLAAVAGLGLAGAWAAYDRGRVAGDDLRVTFLDVGQGDAAVIELPGGEVRVVDAGGAPGALGDLRATARPGEVVARYLRTRRIARVDVAVVSHPHPDHYLGLVALAARVPVARLWSAAEEPPARAAEEPPARAAVEEPSARVAVDPAARRERPRSGADPGFAAIAAWLEATGTVHEHPALGAHRRGDVTIRVLAPVHDPGGGPAPHAAADPVRSLNDNSLVLVIERAGRCVLFTGDLEAEGEADLVAAGIGACDVVKVAHHGSPTSSTPAFVAATRPALAVMSLGRVNRFGFPGPEVVTRWQAAGARVLRTDQVGAVTVTIDRAGALAVSTHDPPPPPPAAALGGRSERQGGEGSVIMWP